MPAPHGSTRHPCPHLESGDARCNHRFTLRRMDQAFCVCMSAWRACPMYQMLRREEDRRDEKRHAITITVRATDAILGRVEPVHPGRSLRATGS